MIELKPHTEGAILPVHAHAGARRNEVCGVRNGRLRVCTTQAPEKGKANAAIAKLLAKQFGLRHSQVALVAGQASPRKAFLIRGFDCAELARRLQ